jgi:alpha-glucosidase (family GH31 glycosyl hydrolase)
LPAVGRTAGKLAVLVALVIVLAAAPAVAAASTVVDAGSLRARVASDRWGLTLVDERGHTVLAEDAAQALGFQSGGVWHRATSIVTADTHGGTYEAELATDDPAGRRISVRLKRSAEGVISLVARVVGSGEPAVESLGVGFAANPAERFLGFGERSNAVDQRGNVVEDYVTDGPYETDEYPFLELLIPPWGFRPRDDATYYPVPWLLSNAGYGVLVDDPETSYFSLDQPDSWNVRLVNAPSGEPGASGAPPPAELTMRFFAGPRPADVLRRYTDITGRQPKPAAPWLFGPWVQAAGSSAEQLTVLDGLQRADAPMSVNQTYLHYLPCGSQRGGRETEQQRTAAIHGHGLAVTTYLNPMVCTSYDPVYAEAAGSHGLLEHPGDGVYTFNYTGSTIFQVGEFDFTSEGGRAAFGSVVDEAIADGHDGWMEDFGEYTPLDSQSADGTPGTVLHNEYPRQYHCAAQAASATATRPIVRFQRSGWTGAAPCADVVWGGDPTTAWGFDGLASAVRQALSIGLSGIAYWGSDIGGYFAIGGDDQLDSELLDRWVQLGAVSGVMRTETDGFAVPGYTRPQVYDPAQLANWRRYAKLRTQLYPYLVAAARQYQRTGLPLMRALALAFPDDATAVARDDEFMFGPAVLAAPVLEPGATSRSLYLPRGRWIDFWRSVRFREGPGSFEVRGARLVRGHRQITVPAPLDQLPLLVRAGAILPLLSPDVDTLTAYRDRSTTSLGERRGVLHLLAFPRGDSSTRFYDDGKIRSREGRGDWTLSVAAKRRYRYSVQASLTSLKLPFRPCDVTVNGRVLPPRDWSVERGGNVLVARFSGRRARLEASAC